MYKKKTSKKKQQNFEITVEQGIRWIILFAFVSTRAILRITFHLLRDLIAFIYRTAIQLYTIVVSQDYTPYTISLKRLFHKKNIVKQIKSIEQPIVVEVRPTKYEHLRIVK